MMTMDSEEEIRVAARDWLLRLSLESPTADDQAQFAAWCAEDPRHAAAYRRFESIWRDAASLKELIPLASLAPVRDRSWRRARSSLVEHPLRWAATASLAAAISSIGVWHLLTPTYYVTGVAEIRDIHLSDGSEVTLGARSSFQVAFRLHERRVALSSGVAFFSVAKNPSRPFIVVVGDKEIRVVGTKFEIRRDPNSMRVSVVEGKVEVMPVPDRASETAHRAPQTVRIAAKATQTTSATIPNGALVSAPPESSEERILTAGQQVTAAPASAIPDPQVMPRGEPAAWRHGRLVYVDAPLKEIIADANRYSREPIEIADEGVANVRVSITYPSDRIEEMVAALSRSLSLEIERRESGGIVLNAKKATGD